MSASIAPTAAPSSQPNNRDPFSSHVPLASPTLNPHIAADTTSRSKYRDKAPEAEESVIVVGKDQEKARGPPNGPSDIERADQASEAEETVTDEEGKINKENPFANQFHVTTIPRHEPVTLNSVNIDSISESKVLYYFGVLAARALLLPRFHYTKGRKSKSWNVKMTMYGMTLLRSHIYETQWDAKVAICREALKRMMSEYPDWVVPERPKDAISPPGWDWVGILHDGDHCLQKGLVEPKYTKYIHQKGYRHEVEVDGAAYFGSLKHYAEEAQSKQGAAHVALYDVLVRADDGEHEFEEPRPNVTLLAAVPRDPRGSVPTPSVSAKRGWDDDEEICELLALEYPDIRAERVDGRLVETEGQYTVAAYFKTDPFLVRAGAVGKIKIFRGTQIGAHQACAREVCNYLICMVKEDMALEEGATKERESITRWGGNSA
ncbi:hypothetical protein BDV18DRAFT_164425 [Aspergillus unguis]